MISIICAVKNRKNALKISLTSWLLCDKISEIILVDWSSDESIEEFISIDERIKVIRVENEQYFNLPSSYNLASYCTTNEYLLKMDAEYVINPYFDFIDKYLPDDFNFVRGCHWLSPSPFLTYLNGLLFIKTENFKKVNGYNELMKDYGYEDVDLHNRLCKSGLTEIHVDPNENMIFHIPHPKITRVQNYECQDIDVSHYRNEMISQNRAPSAYNKSIYTWEIEKIYERYYKAKIITVDS